MSRKRKDDTPPGGWNCPEHSKDPPTHYAAGTKMVRGKLEWVWKPVTPKYLAECEARRNSAGKPKELPAVRTRTRKFA